ncbi:MAG: DedA family protein [Alphaproteobacteria bacterium]|nr:DedA family protein [Alphaproteobacteria bacterium]
MDFISHFDVVVRDFISAHRAWAGPIVLGLSFGESLAFVGILLPATAAMVLIGVMVSQGLLDFWTIVFWATIGAALGDWVSYWIGRNFDRSISRVWPFSRNPAMLEKGHAFFERWGIASVFLGRFFGPLRAVIPLVAGSMDMPRAKFQIANWTSACIWAPYWLGVGVYGERFFDWIDDYVGLWGGVAILIAIAGAVIVLIKRFERRHG